MSYTRLEMADGWATLVLEHPPLNVLNIRIMEQIGAQLKEARKVKDLRALVVRGEGKAFCAGVDVGEHLGDNAEKMIQTFHSFIASFIDFPLPTIAMVHGAALGGGTELCLACDMVFAAEDAVFGQPEIKLAVYPPPATVLLPPAVGAKKAAEIILTGRTVEAQEAERIGLVNAVHPPDDLQAEVMKVVDGLLGLSGAALRHTVEVLRYGKRFLEVMDPISGHYLTKLMKTKDATEGLTAFMEKRRPEWTHE